MGNNIKVVADVSALLRDDIFSIHQDMIVVVLISSNSSRYESFLCV